MNDFASSSGVASAELRKCLLNLRERVRATSEPVKPNAGDERGTKCEEIKKKKLRTGWGRMNEWWGEVSIKKVTNWESFQRDQEYEREKHRATTNLRKTIKKGGHSGLGVPALVRGMYDSRFSEKKKKIKQ